MSTCKIQLAGESSTVSVLHLTDSHLFADEKGTLLGVNTASSFQAVLSSVLSQNIHYDMVIMSGDISQDYSLASYQRFGNMTSVLNAPIFFVPGNHDDGPLMYRCFRNFGVPTERTVICGNWLFVMLNSEVYSVPHGWVEREELAFLQETLEAYPYMNAVVVVHHLPMLVKSRWLDTQTMHNLDEFNGFISRFPNIRLVLCGHVHQEFDAVQGNIRYIATPSTSIQFEPMSHDFALDMRGPGWRYLEFAPNGDISTQVYRLPTGQFVPNSGVAGY